MKNSKKSDLEILNDEVMCTGDFIEAIRRHYKDRNGRLSTWEFVKRKRNFGVVMIAAITDAHELVLERTFRIPLNAYVIELPAGLYEPDSETPEAAVRRELLEETGYAVDPAELLLEIVGNQGLLGDVMAFFLGMHAKRIQEPELEATEDIETMVVPVNELSRFLLEEYRKGAKIDLKILAVAPLLRERGFPV